MQTKKKSAIESIINVILGLILSFLIQLWIYPFLSIKVSLNQNLFITSIFFLVSFIRGYIVRRVFNNLD